MHSRKGTLSHLLWPIFIFFLATGMKTPINPEDQVISINSPKIKKNLRLRAKKGEILTFADVNNVHGTDQQVNLLALGLHPKSCKKALSKLSRYEIYEELIGFVKKSQYDDETGRVYFLLKDPLLPFNMTLNFKLERIEKEGVYTFIFDRGFLKGLIGKIHVSKHENQCFFYATANWLGPHTKINSSIFSIFVKTLADIAIAKLYRISSI